MKLLSMPRMAGSKIAQHVANCLPPYTELQHTSDKLFSTKER